MSSEFGEEDRTQQVAAQDRQDVQGHGGQGAGGPEGRTARIGGIPGECGLVVMLKEEWIV